MKFIAEALKFEASNDVRFRDANPRTCVSQHPTSGPKVLCRAMACLISRKFNYSTGSAASFNQIWIDSIGFNFFARIVFV